MFRRLPLVVALMFGFLIGCGLSESEEQEAKSIQDAKVLEAKRAEALMVSPKPKPLPDGGECCKNPSPKCGCPK